ncbi:MAG: discoidin domain-containing protein [Bacteriovoracaceae bacterium]|nr:discoidin domain-containing protein [Bacteriovoracaceae bacterium]
MSSTFRRFSVLGTLSLVTIVALLSSDTSAALTSDPNAKQNPDNCSIDLREYQHGIDFVARPNGQYYLFWASQGNPPVAAVGNWTHDIYVSSIDPANPVITPKIIITQAEAQEPASAAITDDGKIMISMEDGYKATNTIAQRYGVYDSNLVPVKAYPQMVYDGGHSGHVRAVGNQFVVFYADDWQDGGGVCDLGSGKDLAAVVYDSNGNKQRSVSVVSGNRDWWPMLAGSKTRAALVWQRFVPNQTYSELMMAVLDPATGALTKTPVKLDTNVRYYHYTVSYLPQVDRFLILGSYISGTGFAYLLDNNGNLISQNTNLPRGIVREAEHIVGNYLGQVLVAVPTYPSGLMALEVTASSVGQIATIQDSYLWQYMGISGIVSAKNKIYLVALSDAGLVQKTFNLTLPGDVLPLNASAGPVPTPTPTPNPKPTLLSKGKPAKASSIENRILTPNRAFDGNNSSRWASLEGIDPQWISVDMGRKYKLSKTTLIWDAAAAVYTIQVSDDGKTWTTIYTQEAGRGGTETINLTGSGRYVRMHGTKRLTSWGYSLNEFQIFGSP